MAWMGMSYEKAGRVTLTQFDVYAKANKIKQQQNRSLAAWQAMKQQEAKMTKKSGKKTVSYFDTYEDYYDDKKEFEAIFSATEPVKKKLTLADRNRMANQRRKEEKNG